MGKSTVSMGHFIAIANCECLPEITTLIADWGSINPSEKYRTIGDHHPTPFLVGGFSPYPSERWWTSSVGMIIPFPTEWKVIQNSMVPNHQPVLKIENVVETINENVSISTHFQISLPQTFQQSWDPSDVSQAAKSTKGMIGIELWGWIWL